jgi:prefoldin subunit 5
MSEDLNQQIGRLEAQVEAMQKSTDEIRQDVKALTESMNKWRGAGAILLLVGAVFGFLIDGMLSLLTRS